MSESLKKATSFRDVAEQVAAAIGAGQVESPPFALPVEFATSKGFVICINALRVPSEKYIVQLFFRPWSPQAEDDPCVWERFNAQVKSWCFELVREPGFKQRLETLHQEVKALHAQAQGDSDRYHHVADCLDRAERYIASAVEMMPRDEG